jgi:hypothetical protein
VPDEHDLRWARRHRGHRMPRQLDSALNLGAVAPPTSLFLSLTRCAPHRYAQNGAPTSSGGVGFILERARS